MYSSMKTGLTSQHLTSNLEAWLHSGKWMRYRGHDVFVRISGFGPPLMLLHGFPTSSFDWRKVVCELSKRYTVIMLDTLGLGFSSKPERLDYRLSQHADLCEWLIFTLRLDNLSLVAHDLGVSVAQEMLARRMLDRSLAKINSLIMINGSPFPESSQPKNLAQFLLSPLGAVIGHRLPRSAFERSLRPLYSKFEPPDQTLMDDIWSLVACRGGLNVLRMVGKFWRERLTLRNRLVAPLLERFVPTRFIVGEEDPSSGWKMSERYAALVPQADIVQMDGVGFWPQLERPDFVTKQVIEFVDRHHFSRRVHRHPISALGAFHPTPW